MLQNYLDIINFTDNALSKYLKGYDFFLLKYLFASYSHYTNL